ncbi:LysR family transcriptional regulator [Nocardioides deserti]|uniref:LysR family transcriptional regulator n=1 Tax=Nocardioides deserti TaxID=1588644 RepID=A0ABR6UCE0_9ACTN|nr:LysR family transcriptional regulator [Nocardioides deserti]MBC2961773.1 LysR family transcriptional regulator [Nocardioides deserti]GGO79245.1 LysR family transcriptional regulator [Nocardioides deserti]
MALDPRRLLLLRDVARAGSISAAARELGWTQPAVSQHLARLERDVGGPLLLRGPAGVAPTEAGEALLRRADVVAAELHAAGEELAALHSLRGGRVRLVAFPSAAATLVPDAVGALAADHPGVEVGLQEGEPPEALAAVSAGDADLALAFGYDGPPAGLGALAWRPLLEEPVHLVLPPGRRGPGRRGLAALADADWIGGCVRCRTHLVERCAAAGFEPAVRHSSDDYVVVQNLVARGLGVTVLPASALAAYRHPDVAVVDLPALGRRHVGLVHRPGADAVPATAALVARLVARASADA